MVRQLCYAVSLKWALKYALPKFRHLLYKLCLDVPTLGIWSKMIQVYSKRLKNVLSKFRQGTIKSYKRKWDSSCKNKVLSLTVIIFNGYPSTSCFQYDSRIMCPQVDREGFILIFNQCVILNWHCHCLRSSSIIEGQSSAGCHWVVWWPWVYILVNHLWICNSQIF